MKAIIYAAGRNLRLGSRFADQPKILLKFGGRSLLDWHAQRLAAVGITTIVIVMGYKREQISATLTGLRERHRLEIKEIVNPDFTEGSVLSFRVSLPELEKADGPVLLMDGDVLYPTEMLWRLVKSQHPTALLIDRDYSTADDDPVLVPIQNGRPIDFRKKWAGEADLVGESVGFFKLDPHDLPMLMDKTIKRSRGTSRMDSYDEIIRDLVVAGCFDYEDVTSLPWIEIDFPTDVERAEKEILPAINILEHYQRE